MATTSTLPLLVTWERGDVTERFNCRHQVTGIANDVRWKPRLPHASIASTRLGGQSSVRFRLVSSAAPHPIPAAVAPSARFLAKSEGDPYTSHRAHMKEFSGRVPNSAPIEIRKRFDEAESIGERAQPPDDGQFRPIMPTDVVVLPEEGPEPQQNEKNQLHAVAATFLNSYKLLQEWIHDCSSMRVLAKRKGPGVGRLGA